MDPTKSQFAWDEKKDRIVSIQCVSAEKVDAIIFTEILPVYKVETF